MDEESEMMQEPMEGQYEEGQYVEGDMGMDYGHEGMMEGDMDEYGEEGMVEGEMMEVSLNQSSI